MTDEKAKVGTSLKFCLILTILALILVIPAIVTGGWVIEYISFGISILAIAIGLGTLLFDDSSE